MSTFVDCIVVLRLTSRKSLICLKLQHEPPALVNEFYQVQLIIQNDEHLEISDVRSVIVVV